MTAKILIIDEHSPAELRTNLEQLHGLTVLHRSHGAEIVETIHQTDPDLIVLNVARMRPRAQDLLAELARRKITKPVVLVGANGETASADFGYSHIIGWINQAHTVEELGALIQTALRHPPQGDLVLAKRSEVIGANRRLANRIRDMQTLFDIGKSIAGELNLEVVLRRVADAAVTLLDADESYLLLKDESGLLQLRAETPVRAAQVPPDILLRQALMSGRTINVVQDDGLLPAELNALLIAPIATGSETLGVLGVNNCRQARSFSVEDVGMLTALADWSAIAIQNARLYRGIKQYNRDLTLVNEVSRLVSGTLDVQEVPRLLLQRLAEIVGAECGSLALIDRERGGVVFQLAYDSDGKELKGLRDFVMPAGEGIVGLVAETGHPVIANDVQAHPAWSPLSDQMTGFVTRKLIAVPLVAEGEILGVVELINKKEGDFDQSDVDLLLLVAASVATAVQNARQYAQLRKANQALTQAHQQRIAAERWAVLGKAAANLAHRINNTTTIIPVNAEHTLELLQQVEMAPELRTDIEGNLDRILRNSLYTIELASVLLRRFRKHPAEAQNVNDLVEKALSLVDIPEHIRVLRHLDSDLPPVVTSDLLTDVFVELISNAVRAMEQQSDGLLRIATFLAGTQAISVQITDNGPGIPEREQEQVFEMFYTTHPSGLGFGLWWVKTFLEQQHGDIAVESQPGETTFTITLPRNLPSLRSQSKSSNIADT